jgi:hypothetical protein
MSMTSTSTISPSKRAHLYPFRTTMPPPVMPKAADPATLSAATAAAPAAALARTGRLAYRERHPAPEPAGGHPAWTREPFASLYIAWRGLTSFMLLPVWTACALSFTLSRRPRPPSAACQPLTESEARPLRRRLPRPTSATTILVAQSGCPGRLDALLGRSAWTVKPSVRYPAARRCTGEARAGDRLPLGAISAGGRPDRRTA